VRVALSAGRPRAVVPDVIGFSATRAESLLRRAGFEVSA
jgi:beta-lactam-binding protein with PASTA domain